MVIGNEEPYIYIKCSSSLTEKNSIKITQNETKKVEHFECI